MELMDRHEIKGMLLIVIVGIYVTGSDLGRDYNTKHKINA